MRSAESGRWLARARSRALSPDLHDPRSDLREDPGAIHELLPLHADLVQHREQGVGVRRVLREAQVLAASDAAALIRLDAHELL